MNAVRETPSATRDDVRAGRAWLAILPAMLVPFLGSLAYFVVFRDSAAVRLLYGATKLFTLLWPLIALRWVFREPWPRPGLGRSPWAAILFGLFSGGLIVACMALLQLTSVASVLAAGAANIRAKAASFGMLDHYWSFALALSTFHALLEEYYWRWFVYGRLRRLTAPPLAHVGAGIAFALHHVVIAGVYFGWGWGLLFGGGVALGGIIWSWSYERHDTLLGAWVSHILVDLGLMSVGHHLLFGSWW